jgi:hypothetical protein
MPSAAPLPFAFSAQPRAVVGNGQADLFVFDLDVKPDLGGAGMPHDIRQGFFEREK